MKDVQTFARAAQPAFEQLLSNLGEHERQVLAMSRRVVTGIELDPATAQHVVVLAVVDESGVYRVLARARPVMPAANLSSAN